MEQEQVTKMAAQIRREVIYYLLINEFLANRQSIPEKETLAYEIERISAIPCQTKLLKRLFEEAREYREERGFYPSAVTIADLEAAWKYKPVGYVCNQNVKFGFLPWKKDKELRALPAVKALLEGYRVLLRQGQKIPLPAHEGESEAKKIAGIVANHLTQGAQNA
jgi:hypothetical protein